MPPDDVMTRASEPPDAVVRYAPHDDGLVDVIEEGNPPVVVLSRRGRSLADLVTRRVIDATSPTSRFLASVTIP